MKFINLTSVPEYQYGKPYTMYYGTTVDMNIILNFAAYGQVEDTIFFLSFVIIYCSYLMGKIHVSIILLRSS